MGSYPGGLEGQATGVGLTGRNGQTKRDRIKHRQGCGFAGGRIKDRKCGVGASQESHQNLKGLQDLEKHFSTNKSAQKNRREVERQRNHGRCGVSIQGIWASTLTQLSDWSWQSSKLIENLSAKSHIWPITTTTQSSDFTACLAEDTTAPRCGSNLQLHLRIVDN